MIEHPDRDETLWKIAWVGDTVVGQVKSYINERENAARGYRRGYTEYISTHRSWRLAGRIWRKRHVEPAREREVISHHGQNVCVHVLRSKRAVVDFLDGVHADRSVVDDR